MPKLIVLNGPPGCGKSTLARWYVQAHPLALNLDIDRLRDLIGRWREDAHSAGLLARAMALAAARTHLLAGHDVVVPQYLGRAVFLEQVERLAATVHARFHEVVLLDEREQALRRFLLRTRAASAADHTEVELAKPVTAADFLAMYDRLHRLLPLRPAAKIIRAEEGRLEQTYYDLLASIR